MKKLACALALILLTSNVYAERVALLIGNASYRSAPLRNPVNDVNAMARKLRNLGFVVTAKHNLNRQQMRQTVRRFKQRLRRGDTALLYYSGHGVQIKGQNYLLPINNGIMDAFDISDGGVSLNFLLGNLNSSQAKEKIVILDACRDNPFKSRIKNLSKGLTRVSGSLGTGTLVAFSAESGQVSNDGRGVNGIYTKHLLNHIGTAGISLNQMFMRVRKDVARETSGQQVPKENNGLVNQIYLAGVGGNNPSPVTPKTTSRVNNNAGHSQQWYIDRWNRSQSNQVTNPPVTVQPEKKRTNWAHSHPGNSCIKSIRHSHKYQSASHSHKYGCQKSSY